MALPGAAAELIQERRNVPAEIDLLGAGECGPAAGNQKGNGDAILHGWDS